MKKFKFSINDKNLEFLENISKETGAAKSKILNSLIDSFIQNPRNSETANLDYRKEKNERKNKEVRIFFTQNEYDILKENATKNNHSFVTQEVRFRILNSIYSDKFSNGVELRQFILTKTALNQLGRNLNQFNRELGKKNIVKIDEKFINTILQNILDKIDTLIKNLDSLTKKSQDKIL